jgi:hypothetical protein
MNYSKPSKYQNINHLYPETKQINLQKCPITDVPLNSETAIEFKINGKILRVCSENCKEKIKKIYTYLK